MNCFRWFVAYQSFMHAINSKHQMVYETDDDDDIFYLKIEYTWKWLILIWALTPHTHLSCHRLKTLYSIYMIDFIIVLQVPRIHQSTVIVNWTFLNLMICLIWFFFFVEKRIDDLKSKYIHIPNRIQKQEKQNRLLYWQSMEDVQGKYSSEQTTKKPII